MDVFNWHDFPDISQILLCERQCCKLGRIVAWVGDVWEIWLDPIFHDGEVLVGINDESHEISWVVSSVEFNKIISNGRMVECLKITCTKLAEFTRWMRGTTEDLIQSPYILHYILLMLAIYCFHLLFYTWFAEEWFWEELWESFECSLNGRVRTREVVVSLHRTRVCIRKPSVFWQIITVLALVWVFLCPHE